MVTVVSLSVFLSVHVCICHLFYFEDGVIIMFKTGINVRGNGLSPLNALFQKSMLLGEEDSQIWALIAPFCVGTTLKVTSLINGSAHELNSTQF